jgi:chaperonin GroES
MQLNPLFDQVVVKRDEAKSQTDSGLFIPSSTKDKTETGTVLAVGPGRKTAEGTIVKTTVKVGDTVLFGQHAGQSVRLNGEDYLILREEEIFAIIED